MAITRYEPWESLNQLQREPTRSQENKTSEGSVATAEWIPAVVTKEDDDLLLFMLIYPISNQKIYCRTPSGWL